MTDSAQAPEWADHANAAPGTVPRPDALRPNAMRHDATAAADAERAAQALGRNAEAPWEVPWRGWKQVLRRACRDMISDRASLVAAGCAFYATLALFPSISILVSLYGLAFDPKSVQPHLAILADLLPAPAFALISDRVNMLTSNPPRLLGINLLVSSGIAAWSATTGTKSLITAINHAYEEREDRSVLEYQLTAFGLTILAMLGAVLGLAALVGVPAVMTVLAASANQQLLVQLVSFGLTLAFVVLALFIVYRHGPCRRPAKWRWVAPGSLLAAVLWVATSLLFSFYVSDFARYDVTYGSLGAVAGVMMWFFVSAYVVLLGAELNAELELQTARDSTEGPPRPMGQRGAYVADRTAEG